MMKLCNEPIPKAKDGADRGFCTHPFGHSGKHGSKTCSSCGINLNKTTASPCIVSVGSGWCNKCHTIYSRTHLGCRERIPQTPGSYFRFPKCGCNGILPKRGHHNKFAKSDGSKFYCRVAITLNSSQHAAKRDQYKPISQNTPHETIRKMMADPNCERCGKPLVWEFGLGKTPHLHHNHETGEIYGFTHPICNPKATEQEIYKLKDYIKLLEQSIAVVQGRKTLTIPGKFGTYRRRHALKKLIAMSANTNPLHSQKVKELIEKYIQTRKKEK